MSSIFVQENGASIGVDGNRFYVNYSDGMRMSVPAETLDCITIMGSTQVSTQCVQECLKRKIPILYYSKGGQYFGRLTTTENTNVSRQRRQSALYETPFAIELSKRIISAKIRNQKVVLKRYAKSTGIAINEEEKMLQICEGKISGCSNTA